MLKFKRIYVIRFRDNGQTVAYAKHNKGRTEGSLSKHTFGLHMHQLFAAAKRQGLTMQCETWGERQ
jgi:hypothetical protein